jgi:hypothetical protein
MPSAGIPVHDPLRPSQHPVKMVELRQSQARRIFPPAAAYPSRVDESLAYSL